MAREELPEPKLGPTNARALVLEGPRQLVERSFSLPEIGHDDGLLRIEACGLCGTDHELYTGGWAWSHYGFVPGHETVGVIDRIGSAAAKRWGVAEGDRVAVDMFLNCRNCPPCMTGDARGCERHGSQDIYSLQPASRAPGLWGGYATHHYLAPDSVLHPVPASVAPVKATLFNPLAAGFAWGGELGRIGPGDVVAVLGAGVRGLANLIAAREAGAAFVMLTGHGPGDAVRLDIARRFGADLVVDVAVHDAVEELLGAVGRLADVVVDVTASAPEAFGDAVRLAATRGRVVIAGLGRATAEKFRPDDIVEKALEIRGALSVSTAHQLAAIDVLVSDRYPFDELPRRVAGFADLDELLSRMAGEGDDKHGDAIGTAVERPMHAVFVPDA